MSAQADRLIWGGELRTCPEKRDRATVCFCGRWPRQGNEGPGCRRPRNGIKTFRHIPIDWRLTNLYKHLTLDLGSFIFDGLSSGTARGSLEALVR